MLVERTPLSHAGYSIRLVVPPAYKQWGKAFKLPNTGQHLAFEIASEVHCAGGGAQPWRKCRRKGVLPVPGQAPDHDQLGRGAGIAYASAALR